MDDPSARDTSAAFAALSDHRRRIVCYYLREHERASLETLTDLVTGWLESGPGPTESVSHEDVRIVLHHVHLPKLAESGLVTYDPDERVASADDLQRNAATLVDAGFDADTTVDSVDLDRVLAATARESVDSEGAAGGRDEGTRGQDGEGGDGGTGDGQ